MIEERNMKCLRCGHEWVGPYWDKDNDVPIERHCPKCHSNSVRALSVRALSVGALSVGALKPKP